MRLGLGLRLSDVVAAVRSGTAVVKSTLIDGLVSYWSLNEVSGTRADLVGDNDLTDNNTVLYDTGKNGNAAKFAKANEEYLSAVTPVDITTTASISFWVNPGDDAQNETWVAQWKYQTNGGWAIQRDPSGPNDLTIYIATAADDNGSGCRMDFADANQSAGNWYHILVVFDGAQTGDANRLKVYQNNAPLTLSVGAGAVPDTLLVPAGTATLTIGTFPGIGRYHEGLIDELAIWDRVLTSDERAELYNSGSGKFYNATSEDFEE